MTHITDTPHVPANFWISAPSEPCQKPPQKALLFSEGSSALDAAVFTGSITVTVKVPPPAQGGGAAVALQHQTPCTNNPRGAGGWGVLGRVCFDVTNPEPFTSPWVKLSAPRRRVQVASPCRTKNERERRMRSRPPRGNQPAPLCPEKWI